MPPARHPPPASATLTPLSSHCLSLFPSPYSLRTPLTFVHPSPRSPLEPHSFFTPYSPALRRKPSEKSGPSYLSPARIPRGDPGWREIAPPSPPPQSRHQAPAPASPRRPGQTRPHTPSCPPVPVRPRPDPKRPSFSRRAPRRTSVIPASPVGIQSSSGAPKATPKCTPPRLKSFLEKTLTRAKQPHFAPPTTHLPTVPNAPLLPPMTSDNQPADPLPGRTR